jgi:hypothetical protein
MNSPPHQSLSYEPTSYQSHPYFNSLVELTSSPTGVVSVATTYVLANSITPEACISTYSSWIYICCIFSERTWVGANGFKEAAEVSWLCGAILEGAIGADGEERVIWVRLERRHPTSLGGYMDGTGVRYRFREELIE